MLIFLEVSCTCVGGVKAGDTWSHNVTLFYALQQVHWSSYHFIDSWVSVSKVWLSHFSCISHALSLSTPWCWLNSEASVFTVDFESEHCSWNAADTPAPFPLLVHVCRLSSCLIGARRRVTQRLLSDWSALVQPCSRINSAVWRSWQTPPQGPHLSVSGGDTLLAQRRKGLPRFMRVCLAEVI